MLVAARSLSALRAGAYVAKVLGMEAGPGLGSFKPCIEMTGSARGEGVGEDSEMGGGWEGQLAIYVSSAWDVRSSTGDSSISIGGVCKEATDTGLKLEVAVSEASLMG